MPQSARPRYLTKSLFTLAWNCPTKLAYQGDPRYANQNRHDAFLRSLQYGGFQIGALAKHYFPGGSEIFTQDREAALAETRSLLERDSATIYEGAFATDGLWIRADIVRKTRGTIFLYEVKAKSFDPGDDSFMYTRGKKNGSLKIKQSWLPYLLDIAFQTFVIRKAYPHLTVLPNLYFADKTRRTDVDGLNQKFILQADPRGNSRIESRIQDPEIELGSPLLIDIPVGEEVDHLLAYSGYALHPGFAGGSLTFGELVTQLATAHVSNSVIPPALSPECKTCEFHATPDIPLRDGRAECWRTARTGHPAATPLYEIWNFRSAEAMALGQHFVEQLPKYSLETRPREDSKPGLSRTERQSIQIKKILTRDGSAYLDRQCLKQEISHWKFPLHFIDFETTRVAIPFHKGRKVYEQIAFQFSHHRVEQDGRIEHRGQFLHDRRGVFPNFDFIRALKTELQGDDGTLLCYATHENTVLCEIYRQLDASQEPDRFHLMDWIRTVTRSRDPENTWEGERAFVDLCELLVRSYYHPLMRGSNSIKAVLPAILADSTYLQEKYGRPIYGKASPIPSLNYPGGWTWLERKSDGSIADPYKRLPPLFEGIDTSTLDLLTPEGEDIRNGGAVMIAYARMQFTGMTSDEREEIRQALLKYCELDTLAMVMLYEHWRESLR